MNAEKKVTLDCFVVQDASGCEELEGQFAAAALPEDLDGGYFIWNVNAIIIGG